MLPAVGLGFGLPQLALFRWAVYPAYALGVQGPARGSRDSVTVCS